MRFICLMLAAAIPLVLWAGEKSDFEKHFKDVTLRVDYFHSGTKGSESFGLDQAVLEGAWAGSLLNLVDTLNLGEYLVRVYDLPTNRLLFSRGFSTVFAEWQKTDEAAAGYVRTFSESVRFPLPRRSVQVTISRRDRKLIFHELFSLVVDPADPTQVKTEKIPVPYKLVTLAENGSPHEKVDILILGDGYARGDLEKFRKDAKHFNDLMFSTKPFKDRKKDFNVWALEVESKESGIDIPDKNVWKDNALGSAYNTFGSARYVLTTENKTLRTIAGAAPYDFLCILVNDSRYGGGGIYNLYTTTYTGEQTKGQEWQMDYVYVHEFGHSFGGLGDEYYTSSTGYTDFYLPGVEPWEPNVTALNDKSSLKWKSLVTLSFEIPTPWEKAKYDSIEALRGKLDRLAPDYYEKREPYYRAEMAILKNPALTGKVGAFEGSGYASKGLYRPALDCRMFSLSTVDFDPVCGASLERVIDFYAR